MFTFKVGLRVNTGGTIAAQWWTGKERYAGSPGDGDGWRPAADWGSAGLGSAP